MFVARFFHPTGERVTRHRSTVVECATAEEAVQAIAAPFLTQTLGAEAVEIFDDQVGRCRVLATRQNGKPVKECNR